MICFFLPAGEDISSNQVDLGVTVLTSLGGGHFDDLTRSALDDDVAVLSQSRTLHGESQRGTSIGSLKGVVIVINRRSRHANKNRTLIIYKYKNTFYKKNLL